jgi:elongation factor Ts
MLCTASLSPLHGLARRYATASKVSIKLVAELRKTTQVSLAKAREALLNTNNDLEAAQEWLQKDMLTTGFKRAMKLADRDAKDGLIALAVLSRGLSNNPGGGGIRAAMVELNCETDFVSRNVIFRRLAENIAHTCAYMTEPRETQDMLLEHKVEELMEAPLMNGNKSEPGALGNTVSSAIRDAIVKLGENVSLRRAVSIVNEDGAQDSRVGLHLGSYMHGTIDDDEHVGRNGSLVALAIKSAQITELVSKQNFSGDIQLLGRSLARQVVGFNATRVVPSKNGVHGTDEESDALYSQPFMTYPGISRGQSVGDALAAWGEERGVGKAGVEVLQFVNWRVR